MKGNNTLLQRTKPEWRARKHSGRKNERGGGFVRRAGLASRGRRDEASRREATVFVWEEVASVAYLVLFVCLFALSAGRRSASEFAEWEVMCNVKVDVYVRAMQIVLILGFDYS